MNSFCDLQLEDEVLLAYLDNAVGSEVTAHIRHCSLCQERVSQLSDWQTWLVAACYRHPCPPALVLGEHIMGLLPYEAEETILAHLAICSACADEVRQLQSVYTS